MFDASFSIHCIHKVRIDLPHQGYGCGKIDFELLTSSIKYLDYPPFQIIEYFQHEIIYTYVIQLI